MMLVILHLAFAIVVEYDITFKGGNLVDRKHIELNNSQIRDPTGWELGYPDVVDLLKLIFIHGHVVCGNFSIPFNTFVICLRFMAPMCMNC